MRRTGKCRPKSTVACMAKLAPLGRRVPAGRLMIILALSGSKRLLSGHSQDPFGPVDEHRHFESDTETMRVAHRVCCLMDQLLGSRVEGKTCVRAKSLHVTRYLILLCLPPRTQSSAAPDSQGTTRTSGGGGLVPNGWRGPLKPFASEVMPDGAFIAASPAVDQTSAR